jgi:hypothetical protein
MTVGRYPRDLGVHPKTVDGWFASLGVKAFGQARRGLHSPWRSPLPSKTRSPCTWDSRGSRRQLLASSSGQELNDGTGGSPAAEHRTLDRRRVPVVAADEDPLAEID